MLEFLSEVFSSIIVGTCGFVIVSLAFIIIAVILELIFKSME